MFKYSVNSFWSDEDECYIALIPEFPGLSAFGNTPEEAAAEAKIAAEGFMEVYQEDGCELPKPFKLKEYSGQIRLRLPKALHADLSREAKSEGMSLNSYMVYILAERHKEYQIDKKIENIERTIAERHVVISQGSFPYEKSYVKTEEQLQDNGESEDISYTVGFEYLDSGAVGHA